MVMTTDTTDPTLSVIIPHYNDPARLALCLGTLHRGGLDGVEVIVVDNGSTLPLDDVRAAHPDVRFLSEPARGAAHARNTGVAASRGGILAFLDADCVPALDWLATARAVVARADLVGGEVTVFDETPGPRSGAEAFEAVFAFDTRAYVDKKNLTVTANLVTTRTVFDAVGPFVDGVSEDAEWSARARAKGFSLAHADDLRVAHPSRRDWPALARKWRRITRESYALAMQGPGRPRLSWALKALMMPASAVVHLPKILASPDLSGAGERWRAMVTLVRLRLTRMGWMLRQLAGGDV